MLDCTVNVCESLEPWFTVPEKFSVTSGTGGVAASTLAGDVPDDESLELQAAVQTRHRAAAANRARDRAPLSWKT